MLAMLRHISAVHVVEGAILADENNDVLDRTLGVKISLLLEVVLVLLVILGRVRAVLQSDRSASLRERLPRPIFCVVCSYALLLKIDLLSVADTTGPRLRQGSVEVKAQ